LFQVTDTALSGQCLRRIENPIGVDVDKMPRFLGGAGFECANQTFRVNEGRDWIAASRL
jgi:hypothetical protein